MNNDSIKTYYEELAATYDKNRFGNTYGQFIDYQERQILSQWLDNTAEQDILDLGCGTGRLTNFATEGLDVSAKMLDQAQEKFPTKPFILASATKTPLPKDSFDTVFSFHVFMHLDYSTTRQVLQEVHRILKPNGQFIFDFPSKKRRKLTSYRAKNWHGANHFTIQELQKRIGENWSIQQYQGILFFPIHRFPKSWRFFLLKIDTFLCSSFLKEYASYLVI